MIYVREFSLWEKCNFKMHVTPQTNRSPPDHYKLLEEHGIADQSNKGHKLHWPTRNLDMKWWYTSQPQLQCLRTFTSDSLSNPGIDSLPNLWSVLCNICIFPPPPSELLAFCISGNQTCLGGSISMFPTSLGSCSAVAGMNIHLCGVRVYTVTSGSKWKLN